MDLMKMAAQLFISKLGSSGSGLDISSVMGALQGLLPTKGEELDIQSLIGQFAGNGGLSSLVGSWLGDGNNNPMGADQVSSIFGDSSIGAFAQKLGLDKETASSGLADMIPDLIDKNSKGGNLVGDLAGKVGGQLFEKLF